VNLRIMEKEDLPLITEWMNNPEYLGEYLNPVQLSKTDVEKEFLPEKKLFLVEKKDGTKIGNVVYFLKNSEIGYVLVQNERGKGYGTEAIEILVDYLFLSKDIVRVQAHTEVRNLSSRKALEKAGFTKEGIVRKCFFIRGEWRDFCLYSILREEWKEPKILTRTK